MSMDDAKKKNIEIAQVFFNEKVKEHGISYKSLDWGSPQGQRKRFEVIADIGIKSGDSVLDVGCGLADLYAFFSERGLDVEYTGIDVSEKMIEVAQERFPHLPLGRRLLDDFQPESFDWVVASGIFYLNRIDPDLFLREYAEKMFSVCKKGSAFNCLSRTKTAVTSEEYRADPSEVLTMVRSFCNLTAVRHDYHDSDFTVYMRKAAA